jgi:hypothetical protein
LNKRSYEFYVSIFRSHNSCGSKHYYDTNICQFEPPLTSLQIVQTKIITKKILHLNALQNIVKQNSRNQAIAYRP